MVESICKSTNGRMEAGDVRQFIQDKDILLWCAFGKEIEAIALTEIRNYRGRKMLVILGVSGKNRKAWQHYMPDMEKYARLNDCDGIEAIARKGWLRILKDFTSTHIFIEKMFDTKE
jgi:hypothetical protein